MCPLGSLIQFMMDLGIVYHLPLVSSITKFHMYDKWVIPVLD